MGEWLGAQRNSRHAHAIAFTTFRPAVAQRRAGCDAQVSCVVVETAGWEGDGMEKEVVVVDCSDSAALLLRRLGPTGPPWHWNRHGKSQPLGSKTSTTLAWLGWARTFLGSFQVFFSRVPTCIRTLESERPSSAAFTSAHITWIFWMVQGASWAMGLGEETSGQSSDCGYLGIKG